MDLKEFPERIIGWFKSIIDLGLILTINGPDYFIMIKTPKCSGVVLNSFYNRLFLFRTSIISEIAIWIIVGIVYDVVWWKTDGCTMNSEMSVTDKIAIVNFTSPDMSDSTTAYPIECWNKQIWIAMLSEYILYYSFSPGSVVLSATCAVTHLSQVIPWIMQKVNIFFYLDNSQ